jgi:hypothetical protein
MYPFVLPSGVACELREMTGAEEDILTNARLMRQGDGINQILRNCLVLLGETTEVTMTDVLDMLAGDRLFLLIKLRQVSLGDEVRVTMPCTNPSCLYENQACINLEDLEVTPYPSERECTTTLHGSHTVVVFGPLTGHHEKRLAAIQDPNLTQAMLMRIITVNGQPPTKHTLTAMSLGDRQALRQAMAAADGGIESVIELECSGCGTVLKARVHETPGFFFPNAR